MKRAERALGILVAAYLLLAAAACSRKPGVKPMEPMAALESGDSEAAAGLVTPQLVRIENTAGDSRVVGTGFFDETGYLVTNSHVVDIPGRLEAVYPDGERVNALLVSNEVYSDVAILAVDGRPRCSALPFADSNRVEQADPLLWAGYADGEETAAVADGTLEGRRQVEEYEYLRVDASPDDGCGGGPLFDSRGQLVGLVTYSGGDPGVCVALTANDLRVRIDRLAFLKYNLEYVQEAGREKALDALLPELGVEQTDIYGDEAVLEARQDLLPVWTSTGTAATRADG